MEPAKTTSTSRTSATTGNGEGLPFLIPQVAHCGPLTMKNIRARRRGVDDQGFNLLELTIVLLIIALLMAIAIPTFLSVKRRAQDRSAQTDLRNTMANARTFSVEHQGFYNNDASPPVPISPDDMRAVEGALIFVGPGHAAKDRIGVIVADGSDPQWEPGEYAIFITQSGSGSFYCIFNDDQTNVYYGSGNSETDVDEPSECDAEGW